MNAVQGEGVVSRGRFFGRVVEFERDAEGLPLYDPDGQLVVKSVVTDWYEVGNGATTVGLNMMLNVTFRGATPSTSWYCSLINNSGFTAVSASDTMSSHAGWTELSTYTESTRPQWSPAAASGGSVVNGTAMTFTNNTGSTVTLRGVFIVDNNTKTGTTGTLWATAVEAAGRSLADGQAFQVVYTTSLTPTS